MAKNSFKVLRSFRDREQVHQAGETVSLDDPELIGGLLAAAKIEPADQATADRLQSRSLHEWRADAAIGPHAPALRIAI